jgi:hypothetical protein
LQALEFELLFSSYFLLLNKVNDGKENNPDQINEMPIQTDQLNRCIIILGKFALQRLNENKKYGQYATKNVTPVKTRQNIKACPVQMIDASVGQKTVMNELHIFISLNGKKNHSEKKSKKKIKRDFLFIVQMAPLKSLYHGDAAANQNKSIGTGQRNIQYLSGLGPGYGPQSQDNIRPY